MIKSIINGEGLRILYDSSKSEYKTPFGCIREDEECKIRIGVPVTCPVVNASLIVEKEDGYTLTVPLSPVEEIGIYRYFVGTFSLSSCGLYFYAFRFEEVASSFMLYRYGEHDTNMEDGEKWQLTCLPKDYKVPSQFEGKVVYQIFPDRFAKSGECDLSGKLEPYTIHKDITEPPIKGPDENGNWNCDFYGGNLNGITEKLPYLKSLGIGVIYLNPIFKAYSNHRYDTADYMTIDPMLGTEKDFSNLCQKAKEMGILIILDGVFSHVGSNSIYFDKNKIFGHGAVSDPASPYREWFNFKKYPDKYTSWWGVPTLPCVNELCENYLDLIIRNYDSVVAHYLRLGASGFRLDVADELPDEFIALLRKRVKEVKSDAIVIGEVWEDASNKISYNKRRKYFNGGELDGVMNYVFRDGIINMFCRRITPQEFVKTVNTIYENYPSETLNCCMTLLSSHDTTRIQTELGRVIKNTFKALKAASTLQYFLPGMPTLYYGDEVGMKGGSDPENRAFFREGENAEELKMHYRMLGEIRNNRQELKTGALEISESHNVLKVKRFNDTSEITLYVNTETFDFEIE